MGRLRNDARAGYTLAEMMIGSAVGAFAFAGAFSLQANVLRGQADTLGRTAAESQAGMIGQALLRGCETASHIQIPPPGAASLSTLRAWRNVNPEDGSSALVEGLPRTYSHFCVDPARRHFYVYEGEYPAPLIRCGDEAPRGASRARLTGDLPGQSTRAVFTRAGRAELHFDYSISLPESSARRAVRVERRSTVAIQAARQ